MLHNLFTASSREFLRLGQFIVLGLSAVVCGTDGGSRSEDPPFAQAEAAFMRHDFDEAEQAYARVLQSDTVASHRDDAVIAVAAIRWRVRRDSVGAERILRQPGGSPKLATRVVLERARMLASMQFYEASAEAARTGIRTTSIGNADRQRLSLAYSLAVVAVAVRDRRATTATPDSLARRLPRVVTLLDSLVRVAPGQLEPAHSLIIAASIVRNGEALWRGWQSYYLIGTGDTTRGPLTEPRHALAVLLPRWSEKTSTRALDDSIAIALAESRLFEAAALVALGPGDARRDARIDEIIAYDAFLRATGDATDEYYRATALHHGNTKAWRALLDSLGRELWPRLRWQNLSAPPKYDFSALRSELDRRFGALFNLGETAGYSDLHLGHRVVDDPRVIEQWGKRAGLRFVVLDGIVSNGFQTWAWDGRAGHGGWGGRQLIVQVRPRYVGGPLQAWRSVSDSARRKEIDLEITTDSATDVVRAQAQPEAFLPSVIKRLRRSASRELLDSLRASGQNGAGLEESFKRVYSAAINESSIFAHEGRHAVDEIISARGGLADKEFRAKLSEGEFASRPRLALEAILSETIGDSSPHGTANLRIVRGLIAWMTAHADEIKGFSPSSPVLLQVPLLTDDNWHAAFRSMDPLATPN